LAAEALADLARFDLSGLSKKDCSGIEAQVPVSTIEAQVPVSATRQEELLSLALGGRQSVADLLYERDSIAAALDAEKRRSREFEQLWRRAEQELHDLRSSIATSAGVTMPRGLQQESAAASDIALGPKSARGSTCSFGAQDGSTWTSDNAIEPTKGHWIGPGAPTLVAESLTKPEPARDAAALPAIPTESSINRSGASDPLVQVSLVALLQNPNAADSEVHTITTQAQPPQESTQTPAASLPSCPPPTHKLPEPEPGSQRAREEALATVKLHARSSAPGATAAQAQEPKEQKAEVPKRPDAGDPIATSAEAKEKVRADSNASLYPDSVLDTQLEAADALAGALIDAAVGSACSGAFVDETAASACSLEEGFPARLGSGPGSAAHLDSLCQEFRLQVRDMVQAAVRPPPRGT
jgi:hypothetical protein